VPVVLSSIFKITVTGLRSGTSVILYQSLVSLFLLCLDLVIYRESTTRSFILRVFHQSTFARPIKTPLKRFGFVSEFRDIHNFPVVFY
jgi:hypothetical protein